MIDQLIHLLPYEFVQNALIAGVLVAIVAGLVSQFVVARNMSFAVHALAEVGFTGSAGAILIGLSPVLGLLSGSSSRPSSSEPSGCASVNGTRSSGS